MKAAAYCRVSTEDQREKQSIETQIAELQSYAQRENIELVEFYKDDGVSGKIRCARRPDGARMLADAKAHRFDLLLIFNIKRLGRNLRDLLEVAETLSDHGVGLRSITETFETSSTAGKFMLQMLGAAAELEASYTRENAITASLRRARDGQWLGGLPPLGYKVEQGKLVVDTEQAAVVHRIFSLCADDRMSATSIARLLTAEGAPVPAQLQAKPTKFEGPGRWYMGSLNKILKNRTYIGEHFYNKRNIIRRDGEIVGNDYKGERSISQAVPPIIDPDTFERAAAVLRGGSTRRSPVARRDFLLRSLITCGSCGRKFVGTWPRTRPFWYYGCRGATNGDVPSHDRCKAVWVRGDQLEYEVWADIVEFARNPGQVIKRLQDQLNREARDLAPVQVEQSVIAKSLAEKQHERARVIALVRKALISDEEAETELTNLQREMDALGARREALGKREEHARDLERRLLDTDEILRQLARAVNNPDDDTKRGLMQFLVQGVTVYTVAKDPHEGGRGTKRARIAVTYTFDSPTETLPEELRACLAINRTAGR